MHGHDLILILDSQHRVKFVSPNAELLIGFSSEELMGKELHKFVHNFTAEKLSTLINSSHPNNSHTKSEDFLLQHKHGHFITLEANVHSINNNSDSHDFIVRLKSIFVDKESSPSGSLLSDIIDRSHDLIGICTIEGVVTYLNPSGHEMVGLKAVDEAIGMKIRDFISKDQHRELKTEYIPKLFRSGECSGEGALVHFESGEPIDVNFRLYLVKRGERNQDSYYYMIATKIEFAKEYNKRIVDREYRFRATFEQSVVGMAHTSREGVILRVNQRYATILGFKVAELIGMNVIDLTHPSFRKDSREVVSKHVDGKKEYTQIEKVYLRKDGEPVWGRLTVQSILDSEGNFDYFASVLEDITARKRAMAELEESDRRFNETLKNIKLMAVMLDARGKITFANNHLLELTGWSDTDLIGEDWFDYFIPDTISDEVRNVFESTIANGDLFPFYENEIKTRNGKELIVRWSNTALYDIEGNIIGTSSIGEDISEVIESHLQNEELERQLHHSLKMEAVGRLAGGIAHDFNNLLTAITASADLAMMNPCASSDIKQDLESIASTAERAATLTRQLLTFSRKQSIKPTTIDMNDIILNLERLLKRVISEDIDLKVDLCKESANIYADPSQIEQIIVNLVVNAKDAMIGGGRITIDTLISSTVPELALDGAKSSDSDYIRFRVRDTGSGIDESIRSMIFEPFFTSKPEGEGTGLGLSTVYGIVKQNHGYISVDSQIGKGTTFAIYLPKQKDAVVPQSKDNASSLKISGKERILIVEDEDMVRKLTQRTLEMFGYEVIEASSGAEALAVLENLPIQVDLILTDVVMPNMSGPDFITEVKKKTPDVAALFMSGYTQDHILNHSSEIRNIEMIGKPFRPVELVNKVREVLDHASIILTEQ